MPTEESGTPAPPTHGARPHPLLVSFLVVFALFILVSLNSVYQKTRMQRKHTAGKKPTGENGDDDDSDDEVLSTAPLSEDTYGMAIASMVRDMSRLSQETGSEHKHIRICRIWVSFKLLLLNMSLQIFLLVCIANLAAARAVFSVREAYDSFEKHMYGGHVYLTGHGYARGSDDRFFNSSLFDTLPDGTKEDACRIPLAQPEFLFVILLIWSLLVVGELRESFTEFQRLVISTATAPSMATATEPIPQGEVIVGLTIGLKVWVTFFVVLPRIVIAGILLWLGCRWLAATNDFQELVLNAVGLEFVLLLKELLYRSLVPERDKRDRFRMHMNLANEAAAPSPVAFFGTFLWGVVAFAWVYLYIYCIQGVLPEFRWDVHDVCMSWMKANYAGWS